MWRASTCFKISDLSHSFWRRLPVPLSNLRCSPRRLYIIAESFLMGKDKMIDFDSFNPANPVSMGSKQWPKHFQDAASGRAKRSMSSIFSRSVTCVTRFWRYIPVPHGNSDLIRVSLSQSPDILMLSMLIFIVDNQNLLTIFLLMGYKFLMGNKKWVSPGLSAISRRH